MFSIGCSLVVNSSRWFPRNLHIVIRVVHVDTAFAFVCRGIVSGCFASSRWCFRHKCLLGVVIGKSTTKSPFLPCLSPLLQLDYRLHQKMAFSGNIAAAFLSKSLFKPSTTILLHWFSFWRLICLVHHRKYKISGILGFQCSIMF